MDEGGDNEQTTEESVGRVARREDLAARLLHDACASVHEDDDNERVVGASALLGRQLGLTPEALVGTPFLDLVAIDDRARVKAHRASEKELRRSAPLVCFLRCANGDLIRVLSRMERLPAQHLKCCTTIPLNDSTHYSEDDITTSKDLLMMAQM